MYLASSKFRRFIYFKKIKKLEKDRVINDLEFLYIKTYIICI